MKNINLKNIENLDNNLTTNDVDKIKILKRKIYKQLTLM